MPVGQANIRPAGLFLKETIMKIIEVKGAAVPAIGLGTWMLEGREAQEITEQALETGYTHIDTAQMYANEAEIGKAVRGSGIDRDKLFITTKVWWENLGLEKFDRSVQSSLTQLRTDYIDLLLIHWPHPELPVEEYMERLMHVQEQGITRHIGVSNFTPDLLDRAVKTGAKLVTDQVEYHPYLDQSRVIKACRRHGMSLTAYAPLARGRVTEDETIKAIADHYDKTPAQVTLRWLMQQEEVIAIPKTSTPERLEENFNIFDFELSEKEIEDINALTKKEERLVNPEFAPW